MDSCYKQRKTLLNPIIDWTDEEVWEFIREYNVPYCELYDKGHKRLGCIGCPMSTRQADDLERYPKYKALYIKAFDEMLSIRKEKGYKDDDWKSGEDVMEWWLNEIKKKPSSMEQANLEDLMAEYEMEEFE